MTADLTVRPATAMDGPALAMLDLATAEPGTYVLPPLPGEPFFGADTGPQDVLVAEVGRRIVGYLKIRPPTSLESNAHVQQVQGLAVYPALRRCGVARALLAEGLAEAARRGARKLSLRVLSSNPGAIALYRAAGFRVEGVLREEFATDDGRYADDVLMAQRVS